MATEKLTFKQILVRFISVLVCGVGVGSCVFSLSLQVQDVGNLTASLCWFSGLSAVVLAIAGYVVTCSPNQNSFVTLAVVLILACGVAVFLFEHRYLWVQAVIGFTLAVLAVQLVVLVAYHHVLKREDPQSL